MGASDPVALDAALAAVLTLLATDDTMADASRDALALGYTRFVRTMLTQGAVTLDDISDELVEVFLFGPTRRQMKVRRPTAATVKNRRSVVRRFYRACRTLHLTANDFAPPRAHVVPVEVEGSRSLRDDEIDRCRAHAVSRLFDDRGPAVLALCEASGTFGEIAEVTVDDVDLAAGTVSFRASARRSARTNPLTGWGQSAIRERVAQVGGSRTTPLVVGVGTRGASASSSLSQAVARILRRANIAGDGVTPDSIRMWSAVRIWEETGRIEAVARWTGSRSLDAAARTIGFDWRGDDG